MPLVARAVALEDLDGRRLARAVGPEQAEDLAAARPRSRCRGRPRGRRRTCAGRGRGWPVRRSSPPAHDGKLPDALRLHRHRLEHDAAARRRARRRPRLREVLAPSGVRPRCARSGDGAARSARDASTARRRGGRRAGRARPRARGRADPRRRDGGDPPARQPRRALRGGRARRRACRSRILAGDEEARLAFAGATAACCARAARTGRSAVVDVGGGSSSSSSGRCAGGVAGRLAAGRLRRPDRAATVPRRPADAATSSTRVPRGTSPASSGGLDAAGRRASPTRSAAARRRCARLCGAELDRRVLDARAASAVRRGRAGIVRRAARASHPERVRLLPAGPRAAARGARGASAAAAADRARRPARGRRARRARRPCRRS